MGLFSSPHVTGEALKTAVFAAALFDLLGFKAVSYTHLDVYKRQDLLGAR